MVEYFKKLTMQFLVITELLSVALPELEQPVIPLFILRAPGLGWSEDGNPSEDPAHICPAHLHQAHQVSLL